MPIARLGEVRGRPSSKRRPKCRQGLEETRSTAGSLVSLNEGVGPNRDSRHRLGGSQRYQHEAIHWRAVLLDGDARHEARARTIGYRIHVIPSDDAWKERLARWSRGMRGRRVVSTKRNSPTQREALSLYRPSWERAFSTAMTRGIPRNLSSAGRDCVKAACEAKRKHA